MPAFRGLQGFIIDPLDLSMRVLLNTSLTLPAPALCPVAVTNTGLSRTASADLPLATRLLYRLLHSPHADKQATEHVLACAAGVACLPVVEHVVPGLSPDGWEARVPMAVDAVVMRPVLLTDGECHTEAKDVSAVHMYMESDTVAKREYTVSRKDMGWLIAEHMLEEEWQEWQGKGALLAY